MNNSDVTNPIQPQESVPKETQSSENTPVVIGQKGNTLIIVALVFLMVIIGVGAYLVGTRTNQVQTSNNTKPFPTNYVTQTTPTTNITQISQPAPSTSSQGETNSLKAYTNDKYTYQVKYPSNFQIDLSSAPDLISFTRLPFTEQYNSHTEYAIGIGVFDASGKTLNDFMLEDDKYKSRDRRYSRQEITFNGLPAYKVFAAGFDLPTDAVKFIKNDKLYSIFIKYFDENKYKANDVSYFDEAQAIFNQIVSTFKFQ